MNRMPLTVLRMAIAALIVAVSTLGCGYHGAGEGLTGSERFRCQKADPVEYEACLERARQGNVYHHRY